ncbi:MAG: acyl-CoA reductase [Thermoplasmatota archaeon]
MGSTIDCFFWDRTLGIEDDLTFTYEEIDNGITLRRPVLTLDALERIIKGIKEARQDHLLNYDIPAVLDTIEKANGLWKDPTYEGRVIASEVLPTVTGFSREMIEQWGFDYFFDVLKKENLPLLGTLRPDKFREFSNLGDGLAKAYGEINIRYSNFQPEVIGHICAGNILGLAAFEMIMDKLVDAATWIKVASEEPVFGALYARSLEDIDPVFAHTIAVLPFGSDNTMAQEFLFSKSDIVRATGGENARKSLSELAKRYNVPLAGHWHKFSFITISREFLNEQAREIAELASVDVCAWDQQGCFSPQEIFVEIGGKVSPKEFAKMLSEEMKRTSHALPKGSNSGKIQVLDGYYQYFTKEMMGERVTIFPSENHAWLVIYDESTMNLEPSPLFRVIRVKPVSDIMDIPKRVKPIGSFLQTVGVAIPQHRLIPFADAMGEAGASNMRTISSMTLQKTWEPWDGRFPLHELFEDDAIHWVSIDTRDIAREIEKALFRKRSIVRT